MIAIAALAAGAAHADPKREVPDYDGRGNADSAPDSWVAWIPRVILSPFYVVSEYGLRRPVGAFVSTAERDRWADTVESVATFGRSSRQVILPTALFDFGLLPSVGLSYAGNDMFAEDNALRIHVATWGRPWIVATVADHYQLDTTSTIGARFEFRRAEDKVFLGIGPDTTTATQSRYGLQRVEGATSYRLRLPGESYVELDAGIHRIGFTSGTCCSDPALLDRVAAGALMLPPGYGDTYTTAFGTLDLQLDTRRPQPEPGSVAYLHLHGQPDVEVHDHRAWVKYGGVGGGAVDLTGHQRVLKLQLAVGFIDPLARSTVPFTEFPTLGGDLMAGFIPGWMTGESIAAAQLGYTWPVWIGIDGETRFSVGNAFGAHLDDFAANKLRMSWDIGLTTNKVRDQGLELMFGLGSETFEQGAHVTSVRVAVGSRQGF